MKNHAAECVHKTRRAAALLAGALALSLLAGCAKDESQPVVTDDDLTPSSAVQTALDLEAGNGRTYAYTFLDDRSQETWEEEEAKLREWSEQMIRDLQAEIAEGNCTAEELEELKSSLERMQSDEALEALLAQEHKDWEAVHNLDPVVSPQEAANRAGHMFEEVYGVDLTGKELILHCFRDGGNPAGRIYWMVWADPDGAICCDLDATTGEIADAGYLLQTEEELQSPEADCYIPADPDEFFGRWDPDAPSYQQTIETMKATLQSEVSGSLLVAGASVTDIETELLEDNHVVEFHLTCDNGKTYGLMRVDARTEYDYDGYPLRAYRFGVEN